MHIKKNNLRFCTNWIIPLLYGFSATWISVDSSDGVSLIIDSKIKRNFLIKLLFSGSFILNQLLYCYFFITAIQFDFLLRVYPLGLRFAYGFSIVTSFDLKA